jgi:predicted peptidase
VKCDYTVTQQKEISTGSAKIMGLKVTKRAGDTKKLIDDFTTGSYTDSKSGVKLTYAAYAPAKDSKKHPLIIWLRGSGEVGTDPTMPIAANKSCTFASPQTQSYFGGAYVLSPQYDRIWMPTAEPALMALIKDYLSKNSAIDANRICLGGNSNGGYMTMLLAKDYTDTFAAAIAACEAMPDQLITNADIQKLKMLPLWFTSAKTDTIVPPDRFAVPTHKRLVEAGAKDVHFSYFDKVEDTTGLYRNSDGSPYEYNGHFSFCYVFNNLCIDTVNGKKTTILQWLASQDKSKAK